MIQGRVHPAAITIFGAKGDLTKPKLIPALYNLYSGNHLPAVFSIYCVDFLAVDEDLFKEDLLSGINEFSRNGIADKTKWSECACRLFYRQSYFMKVEAYTDLKGKLDAFEKQGGEKAIRMFYFAKAPKFIEIIAEALYKYKLCNREALDRIIVEKPFGTDLNTARKLNRFLGKRFAEKQIFRIDHYLGKETVQNIMAF